MSIKIIPYKMGSKSVKALSEALRVSGRVVHRVRRDSPTYELREHHTMINWGCSSLDINYHIVNILNAPQNVAIATNKLFAFQRMQQEGVSIPEFTANQYTAQQWYENECPVVGRHKLSGQSGDGIELWGINSDDCPIDAPIAPLYVKYIKKQSEYRVHVFKNPEGSYEEGDPLCEKYSVIDIQQKRKRQETPNEEVDYQVRNHQNGWVFCRDGIEEPQGIRELAIAACSSLGLDFGAVDIIYNEHRNKCFVLEVNCAPGIEKSTIDSYVEAINKYIQEN